MLLAQDEGRFGLLRSLKRCWAPKPLRPTVAQQIIRESLSIFAAVCPQLGHLTALIVPYANSQMMTLFLAQVAAELADYFMVMRVDRAGWHMSHHLIIPDNIRLLPQPPGSPALNPAEPLGDDVRDNETANGLFDSLEHLATILSHGLKRLAFDPEGLRSMTNFPYMQISL